MLNPPYSKPLMWQFVEKLAEHGNGIALLFNRCDSNKFQDIIFKKATGMMFLRNRIKFFRPGIIDIIPALSPAAGLSNIKILSEPIIL